MIGDDRYWDRTWPEPHGYTPFMDQVLSTDDGYELWVGGLDVAFCSLLFSEEVVVALGIVVVVFAVRVGSSSNST